MATFNQLAVLVVYCVLIWVITVYVMAMSAAYRTAMISDLMHDDVRGIADEAGWEGATTISFVLVAQGLALLGRTCMCVSVLSQGSSESEAWPVSLFALAFAAYVTGATCTACSVQHAEACHATTCSMTVALAFAYQLGAFHLTDPQPPMAEWSVRAAYALVLLPLMVMALIPMPDAHTERARRGAAVMQVIAACLVTSMETYLATWTYRHIYGSEEYETNATEPRKIESQLLFKFH